MHTRDCWPALVAPPPGRGQDCHFGDKNSVCNDNRLTAVDNPPPQNPPPDQEASSSMAFHREQHSSGLSPGPQPGHLDTKQFPEFVWEAEAIQPSPSPSDPWLPLGPFGHPGTSLPSVSSLCSLGFLRPQNSHRAQKGPGEAQLLLAGAEEEPGGSPFSKAISRSRCTQGFSSPHTECPSNSGTSTPYPPA